MRQRWSTSGGRGTTVDRSVPTWEHLLPNLRTGMDCVLLLLKCFDRSFWNGVWLTVLCQIELLYSKLELPRTELNVSQIKCERIWSGKNRRENHGNKGKSTITADFWGGKTPLWHLCPRVFVMCVQNKVPVGQNKKCWIFIKLYEQKKTCVCHLKAFHQLWPTLGWNTFYLQVRDVFNWFWKVFVKHCLWNTNWNWICPRFNSIHPLTVCSTIR